MPFDPTKPVPGGFNPTANWPVYTPTAQTNYEQGWRQTGDPLENQWPDQVKQQYGTPGAGPQGIPFGPKPPYNPGGGGSGLPHGLLQSILRGISPPIQAARPNVPMRQPQGPPVVGRDSFGDIYGDLPSGPQQMISQAPPPPPRGLVGGALRGAPPGLAGPERWPGASAPPVQAPGIGGRVGGILGGSAFRGLAF